MYKLSLWDIILQKHMNIRIPVTSSTNFYLNYFHQQSHSCALVYRRESSVWKGTKLLYFQFSLCEVNDLIQP